MEPVTEGILSGDWREPSPLRNLTVACLNFNMLLIRIELKVFDFFDRGG